MITPAVFRRLSTALLMTLSVGLIPKTALAETRIHASEALPIPSYENQVASRALPNGKVFVRYDEAEDPNHQLAREILQEESLFNELLAPFSDVLRLPRDITVVLKECGTSNAYYLPKSSEIVMCYELLADFAINSLSQGLDNEETWFLASRAFLFVSLHEMGHALIHDLNLPVLGHEEVAADLFATLVSNERGERVPELAWAAVHQMRIASTQENIEDFVWDPHGSSIERSNQIICWSYGYYPEAYQDIPEILPETEKARCIAESQSTDAAFIALLQPHFR
jgi:hypothetical protein